MVRASDSGSGDPGSILGRVGVLFPWARDIYSPKVLVIPRNRWLRLNMTEKLFTGTLNKNQNKKQNKKTRKMTTKTILRCIHVLYHKSGSLVKKLRYATLFMRWINDCKFADPFLLKYLLLRSETTRRPKRLGIMILNVIDVCHVLTLFAYDHAYDRTMLFILKCWKT